MSEECYAVLMQREYVDYGIYLFHPVTILKGYWLEDKSFEDHIGTRYLSIEDIEILTSEDAYAIGYPITESELLKKYQGLSISEAQSEYLNDISDKIHFGFSVDEQDKIVVRQFNLMEYSSRINNGEILENSAFNLQTQDVVDIYGGDHVIAISDEKFKQLLMKDNLEELKEELNKIYQGNQEIIDHFEREDDLEEIFQIRFEEITSEKITILSKKSHLLIQKETDLEQVHSILKLLEDFYLKLCLELDKVNIDEINIESEKDILYILIDTYKKLELSKDLNYIKEQINNIESVNKISMVSKKYDELIKHQVKLLELRETFEQPVEQELPLFDVKAIKKYFDKTIIGQEQAKKIIISSIIMNKLGNSDSKNTCLLVGPTGSGKTLIARTVSKYFNVPMVIVDTTQLTVPGYVGASNDDFIVQLIMKANGDIKKAEEGILVFDEIDKKGTEKNDDISGKGVLNTLLPLFQGTTYKVKYNGKEIVFDTSKLTIFATGAFTDVANQKNMINNPYHDTKIGFGNISKRTEEDIVYPKIEIDDLVKYGNMPIELIGRFSNIIQLTGHTKESLKTILTDSSESPLLAEKEKLEKLKIQLTWTEDYLDEIACYALNLKTGARSLKKCVEESIQEVRWEALQNPQNYSGILMTKESVTDCLNCYLIDKDHQKHLLKESLNQDKIYVKTRGI